MTEEKKLVPVGRYLDSREALSIAGRDIRKRLKSVYGSPEEAEKAINEKAQNKADLEHWGTVQTKEAFLFQDIPGHMREQAIFSMAAAYLVWEAEEAGLL